MSFCQKSYLGEVHGHTVRLCWRSLAVMLGPEAEQIRCSPAEIHQWCQQGRPRCHQAPLHTPPFPASTTRSHKVCPCPQKALKSRPEKHLGLLIAGKSRSICDKRQLGLLCLKSKLNITYGLSIQNDLPRLQWVTYEKYEDLCQNTMCVLTKVTFECDLIDCPESHWKNFMSAGLPGINESD